VVMFVGAGVVVGVAVVGVGAVVSGGVVVCVTVPTGFWVGVSVAGSPPLPEKVIYIPPTATTAIIVIIPIIFGLNFVGAFSFLFDRSKPHFSQNREPSLIGAPHFGQYFKTPFFNFSSITTYSFHWIYFQ